MDNYQHILLALDIHAPTNQETAAKGVALAKLYDANISVVHAIEHFAAYGVAQAYTSAVDLELQLVEEAQKALKKFCDGLGYPKINIVVEIGSPKAVILDNAKALNADVIVIGSHGRHGINLLLGSTANAVLHNAKCDVLAVKLTEIKS